MSGGPKVPALGALLDGVSGQGVGARDVAEHGTPQ